MCPNCGEILNTESDLKFHELFHEMDQIDYIDQKPWSPISLGNYEPTSNQTEELMDVDTDQCGISTMETDEEESMYSQPCQSQVNYGDEQKLPYNLTLVGEKTFLKNGAFDKYYQIRFDTYSVERGQRLSDLHRELENTFNDALSQATQGLDSPTDLGRVIIHHEGLANPVYVPLKPLKDLTGKVVMGHLQSVIVGGNVQFVKKIVDRHLRRPEDHFSGEWQCQACKQFVNVDHLCYMRALECKAKKPRYIFYDFECTQKDVLCCEEGYSMTRNPNCIQCNNTESCLECALCTNCQQSWCGKFQHIPNLVVAQKVCEKRITGQVDTESKCDNCGTRRGKCDEIDKEEKAYVKPPCKDTCGFRETVFQGDNIAHAFGSWLFNKTHKDFTVIAHNMKGYDGYFLLEYLLANSIVSKVIYAGYKIMYLHVERGLNIRVLDSLNFLPMKLAELPKAFGLEEMKKGYFPHFFNTKKNQLHWTLSCLQILWK